MAARGTILFVYNVDLTPFALVSDFVHRIMSPETYPCRLCDITYDRFTMKREWKAFIESLPVRASFELRDRFHKKFPAYASVALPAVFHLSSRRELAVVLSAEQINAAADMAELQALVRAALARAA